MSCRSSLSFAMKLSFTSPILSRHFTIIILPVPNHSHEDCFMPNPIATILETQPIVVLDGALATELERRGADLRDALWSAKVLMESPHLIREVHADYFAAGADCATTSSYQATFEGFAKRGLSHEAAADLMRLSVQLAIDARDTFWADPANRVGRAHPFVAASVGPYGAFLADGSEYRGDYDLSEEQLMDFHRPRM